MLLDHLPDGSQDCPLIRLYHFTQNEIKHLASQVEELAAERISRIEVHDLNYVTAIDECQLRFCLRNWDQAVLKTGPNSFQCGFTAGTWDNVVGLIEPFFTGANGFQWLAGMPGEAMLLLSPSGEW